MERFVKITADFCLRVTMIKYATAYGGRMIQEVVKNAKLEDKVIDITKGKAIKSVLCLTDGDYVLTSVGFETLIRKLNSQETDGNSNSNREELPWTTS